MGEERTGRRGGDGMKLSNNCPTCKAADSLKLAGWMLLGCSKCGAQFEVYTNGTMEPVKTGP